MLIEQLKEQGFFENQSAIIKQAKTCGLEQVWVIVPNALTSLNKKALNLMYVYQGKYLSSRQAELEFLDALENHFKIKCKIKFYNKKVAEETITFGLSEKAIMEARLKSVVPLEKLSPEVDLMNQVLSPLEIPAPIVFEQKLEKTVDFVPKSTKKRRLEFFEYPKPPKKLDKESNDKTLNKVEPPLKLKEEDYRVMSPMGSSEVASSSS